MILVKGLQKYQRLKLEVEKESAGSAGPGVSVSNQAKLAIFFISNFDPLAKSIVFNTLEIMIFFRFPKKFMNDSFD